jgi:transcription antitermination protein NusB
LLRLDMILRLILEAGAYEIVHRPDIPPRVTMSEYIAIADAFFGGKEPGLANGVLDRLARTLRAGEL